MHLTSVEIENILSIESANISFENNGLVLIEGWNYDADRANGAGKTAIFNSICYALYDKIPRKITATEILKRGAKSGSVTLNFTSGGDEWTVVRKRPKDIKFYKNKTEQTISQAEFESILGLNYEQFLLTIYNPQSISSEKNRFLSCSDSDKKTFLLKLLNLEKFENLKKIADQKTKEISLLISEDESKINNFSAKIEAYSESLEDLSEIESEKNRISSEIERLTLKLTPLEKIKKPDIDKLNKLEEELTNKLTYLIKTKAKREILFDQYRKVDNNTIDEKCSMCGSDLDSYSIETHKNEKKNKLLQLKEHIDSLDALLSKENGINELMSKTKEKKKHELSDYELARTQITDIYNCINKQNILLKNAVLKLENNNNLFNKIKQLQEARDKITSAVDENKRKLEFYKTLSGIYSPTGAQAYVLDSIIDYFNEVIEKYMQILWPNSSYTLNSYKETSKGETVAKFSEILTMEESPVSIGSLSGGEFRALSLCIDFALIDVMTNQFGIQFNPIMLDEPFDGLDASGREVVISLLEKISSSKQIIVVDHASESKVLFSKIIRVEKKNGVSLITLET